jgi:hypothetical protein
MSDDYPEVLRYLCADQSVGHEELRRARFVRTVKAPAAWAREEREDGVVGYYLKQGALTGAIWGAIPHAPRASQRWGWAVYISGGGEMVEVAGERPAPDTLAALAASPVEAHARMVKAYDAWRTGLPALPLLRTAP